MRHKSCRTLVGSTRQSIFFARSLLTRMMDPRVKPAGDGREMPNPIRVIAGPDPAIHRWKEFFDR